MAGNVICLRFTPAEYTKLSPQAKQLFPYSTIPAFCKKRALAGCIIHLDMQPSQDIMEFYRDIRTLLRQILLSIYRTGRYSHADMCNIQSCIDRMGELTHTMLVHINGLLEYLIADRSAGDNLPNSGDNSSN